MTTNVINNFRGFTSPDAVDIMENDDDCPPKRLEKQAAPTCLGMGLKWTSTIPWTGFRCGWPDNG